MPYLKKDDRDRLNSGGTPTDSGSLNYVLTNICLRYIHRHTPDVRYKDYNDVIGALEACKLELYARAVRPYEDQKIKENGDVYA